MAIRFNTKQGGCSSQSSCPDKFGCPTDGTCPDFSIRRHDTKPPLKISVEDCDGPFDLQGLVIEANMWAKARLKTAITDEDDCFRLADDIGFEQVMQGDIIVMDRVRMPEHMLVTGFDETNKLIRVQRGHRSTTPSAWKKGSAMRIFRVMNAPAEAELVYQDIQNVDGTTDEDVLTESLLVYEWQPEDVCLPGCYWFEFKVLKMIDVVYFLPGGNWTGENHTHTDGHFYTGSTQTDASVRLSYDQVRDIYLLPDTPWTGETHVLSTGQVLTGTSQNDGSVILNQTGVPSEDTAEYDDESLSILSAGLSDVIPSFTDESLTPYYFGCVLGEGVEWARRFPLQGEGFLVKIEMSPTTELI